MTTGEIHTGREIPSVTTQSIRVVVARSVILILTLLFVAGALGQFFLAGMAVFDDPTRWPDHKSLGHIVGIGAMVIWIPALLGRVGVRLIVASFALLVLFEAQYGFANAGPGAVRALHAVNGAVMLVLACGMVRALLALMLNRRTADA